MSANSTHTGYLNANDHGFHPDADGVDNAAALQRAVDHGGTVVVSQTGTYELAGTVYVGSQTTLEFGNGVFVKKVDDAGEFCHVLLNKGALTKDYDHDIVVRGLHVIVNGVDCRKFDVYGLHGQLAFFYAKDVRIERFRCLDLGPAQYGIHVCTFEDLIVDDVVIKGEKDGVHLGCGRRFTIRNGVFQTFDDAIALNGHDYSTGNPELGWIEDGVIENCHDLDAEETTGFFCRILAGAWSDWQPGMEVQQSDSVVSNGRVYRVQADPDGTVYTSTTQPTHESGCEVLDGIPWGMAQADETHTAGVRNVTFRDIFLEKARTSFSIHFDTGRYSRSYYPGSTIPMQRQIVLEGIRVLNEGGCSLLTMNTPVDGVTITRSTLGNNGIRFGAVADMSEYPPTQVSMVACTFAHDGPMTLLKNKVEGKEVSLKTVGSIELNTEFCAHVDGQTDSITLESDLTGLK